MDYNFFVVINNMSIMFTRNMKFKIIEQVLQESTKVGHVSNLEWLKQPKIDPKETKTFQSEEQIELDEVIKDIEPKNIKLIENHPPKLWHIKTKPKSPWETIWDLM
jgi:hypothetical protein